MDESSELDLLFDMLSGEGYSEDSGRVYPGLSEADPAGGGWDPAVVINDPAGYSPALTPDPADAEVARFASDDTSSEEGDVAETVAGEQQAPTLSEPEELELPLEPAEDEATELPAAPSAQTDNDASLEDVVPESAGAPASAAAAEAKSADAPNDVRPDTGIDSGPDPDRPAARETVVEVTQVEIEVEAEVEVDLPEPATGSAAGSAAGSVTESAAESGQAAVSPEAPATGTPAKKSPAKKRKRAEVPSWDEIMFGGPKRP